MPELISLIYDFLPWIRDQVKFSFTCKYVHAAMSNDIRRILDIRRKYIPILNEINAIKYTQYHDCISTLEYNDNRILYHGNCSSSFGSYNTDLYYRLLHVSNFSEPRAKHKSIYDLWHGKPILERSLIYSDSHNCASIIEFIAYWEKRHHDHTIHYSPSNACDNLRLAN